MYNDEIMCPPKITLRFNTLRRNDFFIINLFPDQVIRRSKIIEIVLTAVQRTVLIFSFLMS